MVDQVRIEIRDRIALLTMDRAPVNALTPTMRTALDAQLDAAIDAPDVDGVVLTGAGRGFCPGVDLSEYNNTLALPWVSDLCTKIENAPKPVVVALHGAAMGAGFELALAAHARVAQTDARLAMPDVKLGMTPGGGATQRLPRILGAQRALEMLLSGQVVHASDTRLLRMIAQLTQGSPVEEALQLAKSLARKGQWPRTRDENLGFSDPEGFQAALSAIRTQIKEGNAAANDILQCVEAAQLLPFDQGLILERAMFEDRLQSPSARGARHFLMAEKFAATPPRTGRDRRTAVRQIAVMGRQTNLDALTLMLLNAGFGISIVSASETEAEAFSAWLARALQRDAKQRKLSDDTLQKRLSLLDSGTNLASLAKVDLIIDDASISFANPPELRPHAIWSVLEPQADARARGHAVGQIKPPIGLHAYSPIGTRPVIEMSCGAQHSGADVAAVMAVIGRAGKSAVLSTMRAGTLRAVLGASLYAAALELIHHGANPYVVDAAARKAGFDKGPFQLIDRAGLPSIHNRLTQFVEDRDLPDTAIHTLTRFIKEGQAGRSAGRGFYIYTDGTASQDGDLKRLLPPPRRGMKAQKMDTDLMASALIGALVNEAVDLIWDKRVRRASDIDLVLVKGFGFDRARGGPLLQVDLRGVFYLFKDMQTLAELSPLWTPKETFADMVKHGNGFFGRSVG